MKVSVFGAGYVGLVIAACLAEMGNSVVCVDIDEARMNALNCGEMPIHEPGLTELVMRALCAPFLRNRDRILIMDWASAELSKYVANAMLARRISVMNRMALLAERMGADIERVRLGIGSDPRIGTHLLCAGCGWGGSCFPKDVKALARMGEDAGHPLTIIESVRNVNDAQRLLLLDRVVQRFGDDLRGLCFGVWGLAFKPVTDDLREAPSLVIIDELLRLGAKVQAFDSVAMPKLKSLWGERAGFELTQSPMHAGKKSIGTAGGDGVARDLQPRFWTAAHCDESARHH